MTKIITPTKTQTYWVLVFCITSVWVSFLAIIYGPPIKQEKWEPQITEPSVIIVTPLDSPNGCYSQNFYGRVE